MRTRRDAGPLTPEELIRLRGEVLARGDGRPDLSPREVAVRLGLSDYTVREYVRAGEFPGAWAVGNRIRIPARALDFFRERRLANREDQP
jgi:excisionase family DNA binding protein